jgi:catechol 2,3-dioxygenase-like lactoylglutathione lyase family enzyme
MSPRVGHHGRVLSSAQAIAFVPSTDLARSRAFYEGVLGLPVVGADSFAVVLQAGSVTVRVTNVGASLHVQPFTVLGWEVADVPATIRSLVDRGVTFLRVDGLDQDEDGIWTTPDGTQVAWFRDPDGNTLSLDHH